MGGLEPGRLSIQVSQTLWIGRNVPCERQNRRAAGPETVTMSIERLSRRHRHCASLQLQLSNSYLSCPWKMLLPFWFLFRGLERKPAAVVCRLAKECLRSWLRGPSFQSEREETLCATKRTEDELLSGNSLVQQCKDLSLGETSTGVASLTCNEASFPSCLGFFFLCKEDTDTAEGNQASCHSRVDIQGHSGSVVTFPEQWGAFHFRKVSQPCPPLAL